MRKIIINQRVAAAFCALSNMGLDERQIVAQMPDKPEANIPCNSWVTRFGQPWIEDEESHDTMQEEARAWIKDKDALRICHERLTKLGHTVEIT